MYLAELHGKISSKLEKKEDMLTSNVFSFFKYCNRSIFLKNYLSELGFEINDKQANEAEFIFWQRYEENTEPDLIIRTGKHYILFEAKYFSDFDEGSSKTKAQLIREIEAGLMEANSFNETFILVAITADYCYKDYKFSSVPSEYQQFIKWTNWQKVASLLQDILNAKKLTYLERIFATDLYSLLCKKNLRVYRGTDILSNMTYQLKAHDKIFLEAKTARFRDDFIGFREALINEGKLSPSISPLFFGNRLFSSFENGLELNEASIFFCRKEENE